MNLFFFQSRNTMAQKTNVQLRRIVEDILSWTPLHQILQVEATYRLRRRHPNCLFVASSSVGTSWWKYDYFLHHEQVLGNVFEWHATKCCGILKIHRRKTQGAKRITLDIAQQLKAKNFNVQPGHMLCHQCIAAYKNINASSSDTEVEDTPMDDIDENVLDDATYEVYETTSKRLNTSLETVGVSPVNLYGVLQHNRIVPQATSRNSTKLSTRIKAPSLKRTMWVRIYWTPLTLFLRKVMHSEKQQSLTAAWCYEGEIENCFISWEDSDTDTDPWRVVTRVCIKTVWIKTVWCEWIFDSDYS